MSVNFPSALDALPLPAQTDPMDAAAVYHDVVHDDLATAVMALEAKVGVNGSAVTTSLDYLLRSASSVDPGHLHTIAAVSGLQAALDGKAALSHTHSASDITSGTLAVARGGTALAALGSANQV